jgi:hypothetical protein
MVITYPWTLHDKLWSTAGESFGDTLFGESWLGGIGTGAAEEAPGGGTRKGGSNSPIQEANPMELGMRTVCRLYSCGSSIGETEHQRYHVANRDDVAGSLYTKGRHGDDDDANT